MLIQFLQKNKFFRKIIYKAGDIRARDMVKKIQSFLDKKDLILDIGSGTCNVCEILSNKGYKITPLDVQNLSFVNNMKPVIYDGNKIPFNDNRFDKSLILTVLHHTPEPEKILYEAKRVSKKIIIIEDIYVNWLHKYVTYFFDSLLNLEFAGHPHTNKDDKQWKKTFEKLGLKLIDVKYNYSLLVFKHATYYLEK
ncbi:MAG: SAM-dependent methyltransferase [Parcubacteria group bacterium CG10_big_fil_rev_8_21_14_0_10_36_14]|nr:MAG: SAM-dependent methyltransferase [Parcubacteria group bacterium CG10_big_fil_rev_8_21_14_0_10_36_14]